MKTSFLKLILSLFVVLGAIAVSPAPAKIYRVTHYDIFKDSAGDTLGYVLTGSNSSTQCCFFNLSSNPSPEVLVALATAKQMNSAVVYFFGNGASGPYGDFEDQDSGDVISSIGLYRDPALLSGNTSHGIPIEIIAGGGTVTSYQTCNPGQGENCKYDAGYGRNYFSAQMITTEGWITYWGGGYTVPLGALVGLYSAFSGKYGVSIDGFAPVSGIRTHDCVNFQGVPGC